MSRRSSTPTMKDIASSANVSIGTVSRVLNRHEDVDDKLRARVENAARSLGYRLQARTRSVVHAKSRIVGLMLCNDFDLSSAHAQLLLGVEEHAAEAGFYVLFARHHQTHQLELNGSTIPGLMQTPGVADCVIVVGTVYQEILDALHAHGLKYVLLANHLAGAAKCEGRNTQVRYDDEGGIYAATRYLVQLGHKQIWYIGDVGRTWHSNRCKGYVRAMTEFELEPHIHTIALSDDEFDNGQAATANILDQGWPVTAIVAGSDELAFGAREGLRLHRREAPKDVSLIGFEHQIGRSRGSNITSVCVDMIEVGRQLARLAIAQIRSPEEESREVVVPTTLVRRSTCRPLRKEEHMVL
jgi:DNA-binding LacI/PurR family transcriptional regulator